MNFKKLFSTVLCAILIMSMMLTAIPNKGMVASAEPADTYTFDVSGTLDYGEAFDVLAQLNTLRAGLGLPALVMDKALLDTAMQRAAELSIYYSHTRPDDTTCWTAFPSGYSHAAENIAAGPSNATAVMTGWTNSSGHYVNMISEKMDAVGIGCFYQGGTRYWVQVFTGGRTSTSITKSGTEQTDKTITAKNEWLTLGLSPTSATIAVGGTQAFSLYNTVNEGWTSAPGTKINPTYYETTGSNVATVDGNGLVTGVGAGSATLKLGLGSDFYAEAGITVVTSLSYTITATANTGGSISPSGSVSVTEGGNQTFTITPDSGYRISYVHVDNQPIGAASSYTFTNVTADHTIEAVFVRTDTVPTAPQSFTATSGDGQVTLSWSAPSSNGGSTITSYQVSKDGGITWVTASSNTGHIFTGLTNGTSYTFKVRAVNSVGNGAEASATATPMAAAATYTITFNSQGGSAVASITGLTSGSTVTTSANPTRVGYTFTGWYKEAACNNKWNFGTDTVTGNITLYAGWEKITEPKTHTSYVSGYPDGTFKPGSNMTRAEAAQMFYSLSKAEGSVSSGNSAKSFSDVKKSSWYYEAVTYLAGTGVISGYADGTFKPGNTITRAEFTTMAIKYAGLTSGTADTGFSDVSSSHWAAGNIASAVKAGYVSGYPDGTFRPGGRITRAEAVSILNRVRGCAGLASGKKFSDVSSGHWAYKAITAASTTHTHG